MSFRLVPISVTLNDLERRNGYSQMTTVSVWAIVSYDRDSDSVFQFMRSFQCCNVTSVVILVWNDVCLPICVVRAFVVLLYCGEKIPEYLLRVHFTDRLSTRRRRTKSFYPVQHIEMPFAQYNRAMHNGRAVLFAVAEILVHFTFYLSSFLTITPTLSSPHSGA